MCSAYLNMFNVMFMLESALSRGDKSRMDCDEDGQRPFFDGCQCHGMDESVVPLEYIGRDLLATFRSLLHASGLCIPKNWQDFQVRHLNIIRVFLQECIDQLPPENGNQDQRNCKLPVPASTLSSILGGKPDPSLSAFIVESLNRTDLALPSSIFMR